MFLLIFILLFLPKPAFANILTQTKQVTISASIGENQVTINGYTSPGSKVELSSSKVYDLTYSDDTGYFEFDKTLLPKNPSELCLSSIDDSNRRSFPTCIPPPPDTNYHTDIGPVILPPTLTLDQDKIKPGSTVISSGQSIPNSQIQVYFYKVENNARSFPKSAHAYSLPAFTTTTDQNGNFSLNLPTAYSSDYRLYASTQFQENFSPKSNTLIYSMPSLFWLFLIQNPTLVIFLSIFVITIITFLILTINYYHQPPRYLPAIRPSYLPATFF